MRVKGYYLLRCSDVIEDSSIYNDTIDEIDGLDFSFKNKNTHGNLKLKIADDESQVSQIKNLEKLNFLFCDNVLIVEGEIQTDSTPPEYIIEKKMRDFLVLITICKIGVIDCTAGELFINGNHRLSCDSLVHSIDFTYLSMTKFKWPKLNTISIPDSLDWWEHYNSTLDYISDSKVGRAINAYSHLFNSSGGRDDPAKLFWALVGIEAIYVEGNSSLQDQVNRKTQIFLGERHEFKKMFSQMYEYRSRFVHGDLNFENKYFLDNDNTENHFADFWMYRDFAVSILVNTLQRLIKTNKHELEFDYVMK